MLYFDITKSKKCAICHIWYFLNKGFKFQLDVSNRCHDLLIMSTNFISIAIFNMQNTYLTKKSRTL